MHEALGGAWQAGHKQEDQTPARLSRMITAQPHTAMKTRAT
ncbi:MAG: hypothetical protein ACI8RZ_006423, partial [Myxococcota bacterium]